MGLYRPLVLWWCRNRVSRREDAEDVAQEVFATVASKLRVEPFVRERHGGFRTWLKQITLHKLQEHWKKGRHQPAGTGDSAAREALEQLPGQPVEQPLAEDAASERRIVLRSALEMLRPEFEPTTWEAALRTVEGQPARGVASDLGLSVNAVYVAKSRVLGRLRQFLAGLLD
jgi:RNA polymerase sigma-70 factor (ECF subfamily)